MSSLIVGMTMVIMVGICIIGICRTKMPTGQRRIDAENAIDTILTDIKEKTDE